MNVRMNALGAVWRIATRLKTWGRPLLVVVYLGVCSGVVSAQEQFEMHVYGLGDQRAFTTTSANEVLQGIHRNVDFIAVSVDILMENAMRKLREDGEFDKKVNPIFGRGKVNWHQFLRFEITSQAAQAIWSHQQLTLEFFRVDKAAGEPLMFFRRTKDRIEAGVSAVVKIKIANGRGFPNGTLRIKVGYDSSNSQGGIEPMRIEGEYLPVMRRAVTKLERLEAKFQLSRIQDLVHSDVDGEIRLLREILTQREASAVAHSAIAYALKAAGKLRDSLTHARRYQVLFEGELDPTWFSNAELQKAGFGAGFWDMKGLGAMDDIETLEELRGQPSDSLVLIEEGDSFP